MFTSLLKSLRPPSAAARKGRLFAAIILLVVIYVSTIPGNKSEAEDAFWYAEVAEKSPATWQEILHPHHLLYFPLIRSTFVALQWVGVTGRSYAPLLAIHLSAGVVTSMLFFSFIRSRLRLSRSTAYYTTFLFAFSYGFWRYTLEVEIPVWTCLFSLLLLHVGFRDRQTPSRTFSGGLVGATGAAIHVLNVLPALLTVPFRLLRTSQPTRLLIYSLGLTLPLAWGYLAIFGLAGLPQVASFGSAGGVPAHPLAILKGLSALGQSLVSGNFIWSIPPIARGLQETFSNRSMEEEVFMGKSGHPILAWLSIVTLSALCVVVLFIVFGRLRRLRSIRIPAGGLSLLLWLTCHVLVLGWYEADNPELWIPASVPIWSLFAMFVVEPVVQSGHSRRCALLCLVFFLHNLVGGMAWVMSPRGDLVQVNTRWLIENAKPQDLILTNDKGTLSRYLSYWTEAKVLDLYLLSSADSEEVRRSVRTCQGRLFVMSDAFDPPAHICRARPSACEESGALARQLKPLIVETISTSQTVVYQLRCPSLPP